MNYPIEELEKLEDSKVEKLKEICESAGLKVIVGK